MSPITAEDEFLLALTTVRATYGTASINENDLKEIVATEESRVADASVIAELLASRLAAQQPPPATATDQTTTCPSPGAPSPPTPIPFPTGNSNSPLSVAAIIDGLLTQQKRDVREPSQG